MPEHPDIFPPDPVTNALRNTIEAADYHLELVIAAHNITASARAPDHTTYVVTGTDLYDVLTTLATKCGLQLDDG